MTTTTTTLLYDEETERELITGLLLDGGAIELCRLERLEARMFWNVRHEWIYGAMVEIDRRGDGIDDITVANTLESQGKLAQVQGDTAYLSWLMANYGKGLNVRSYAADIRRLHEWRQLKQLAEELGTSAVKRGDGKSVVTVWSEFKRKADAVRPYEPNQNFTFGVDTFEVYRQQREEMLEHSTAYDQPHQLVMNVYGKAQPGDMFGVIGPTGSGKSSELSTVAEFYAEALGMRTVYIFTEMRLKKVLDRRMAKYSGINYRRLKNPVELEPGEDALFKDAESRIMDWAHKLNYWHAPSPTAGGLLATMARMVEELGTQVFVIDHMNDVDVSEYDTGAKDWMLFLIDLEAFCNEHGVLLWTAAQTNRDDGKAYMIGQAFDYKMSLVMELQPQELKADFAYSYGDKTYTYFAGQNSPVVPVYCRKVRDGSPSRGKLLFVGPRYLYVDVPEGFDDGSDDTGAYEDGHIGRGAKD